MPQRLQVSGLAGGLEQLALTRDDSQVAVSGSGDVALQKDEVLGPKALQTHVLDESDPSLSAAAVPDDSRYAGGVSGLTPAGPLEDHLHLELRAQLVQRKSSLKHDQQVVCEVMLRTGGANDPVIEGSLLVPLPPATEETSQRSPWSWRDLEDVVGLQVEQGWVEHPDHGGVLPHVACSH